MRKLRAAALAAILMGFAGLFAVVSAKDINLTAVYILAGIGMCGCALMFISGVVELAGIIRKRISAKHNG